MVYLSWTNRWYDITGIVVVASTVLLHKFVAVIVGGMCLVLVFSSKLALTFKFSRLVKLQIMLKLFRHMLVWRSLRLFELTALFYFKTVALLIIDSRNTGRLSSLSFSTNTAFESGFTKFGQNQYCLQGWLSMLFVDLDHRIQSKNIFKI